MRDSQALDELVLDARFKGFPLERAPFRLGDTARQGLHLLRGDLPFPCAVLRAQALDHNIRWYAAFARELGIDFAPHGKTSMAPQLFARQLHAGAWGITVGTVQQAWVAASAGAPRIVLANQIATVGEARRWLRIGADYPGVRMISLLDSQEQLGLLAQAVVNDAHHAPGSDNRRAFEVLIELGRHGGRTGCRSVRAAHALALQADQTPGVRVVGVEAYEGLAASADSVADAALVSAWMGELEELVALMECDGVGHAQDELIVSAGGSSLFDLVADALVAARARAHAVPRQRPWRIVLRSGCYITHDDGSYLRMQQAMEHRGLTRTIREGLRFSCCAAHWRGSRQGGLQPALEVWAAVQSRPEPELALVGMGRRDAGSDAGMPIPVLHARDGTVVRAPAHWRVRALNDQHGYLIVGASDALRVGDLVGFGISHPCTTLDKWRLLWVIDDAYNVQQAICTCF